MKESGHKDDVNREKENVDEFKKRAQSIQDRLSQADQIFDDMQKGRSHTDKAVDSIQEIFDQIEKGIKKLLNPPDFRVNGHMECDSALPKHLIQYLRSCSNVQLKAIKHEINRIMEERSKAIDK
jgi:regulator of sigma D